MRRFALILATALLMLAACSRDKADPAIQAVCKTRTQTQSSVSKTGTASADRYPAVINGLDAAIKVAPADIKPDFVKVRDVLKPFVDALVKANGDTEVAAKDPNYAAMTAAVGTKEATAAAKRVRAFYEDHC